MHFTHKHSFSFSPSKLHFNSVLLCGYLWNFLQMLCLCFGWISNTKQTVSSETWQCVSSVVSKGCVRVNIVLTDNHLILFSSALVMTLNVKSPKSRLILSADIMSTVCWILRCLCCFESLYLALFVVISVKVEWRSFRPRQSPKNRFISAVMTHSSHNVLFIEIRRNWL